MYGVILTILCLVHISFSELYIFMLEKIKVYAVSKQDLSKVVFSLLIVAFHIGTSYLLYYLCVKYYLSEDILITIFTPLLCGSSYLALNWKRYKSAAMSHEKHIS